MRAPVTWPLLSPTRSSRRIADMLNKVNVIRSVFRAGGDRLDLFNKPKMGRLNHDSKYLEGDLSGIVLDFHRLVRLLPSTLLWVAGVADALRRAGSRRRRCHLPVTTGSAKALPISSHRRFPSAPVISADDQLPSSTTSMQANSVGPAIAGADLPSSSSAGSSTRSTPRGWRSSECALPSIRVRPVSRHATRRQDRPA